MVDWTRLSEQQDLCCPLVIIPYISFTSVPQPRVACFLFCSVGEMPAMSGRTAVRFLNERYVVDISYTITTAGCDDLVHIDGKLH